jgi:tRNA G18 (ribose-2'-O)-methylase SpoU
MPIVHVASPDDPRLRPFLRVDDGELRRREGVFLAEGRLVVRRLLADRRYVVRAVLLTDAAGGALEDAVARRPDVPVYVVPLQWMAPITGFDLHRGCLAVAQRPGPRDWTPSGDASRALILEGIGNPDNVGGLFRTAYALGVEIVFLGPGTGDPLYRKALRVSCGAALAVPFATVPSVPEAIARLQQAGVQVWALTPAAEAVTLADACRRRPRKVAVMVGAEGPGLTADAIARACLRVRIPVNPAADSLNVTVAAGIALAALGPPLGADPP